MREGLGHSVKLFVWMTEKELAACAAAKGIKRNKRLATIRELEERGWEKADVSDLSAIKFKRKPLKRR